MYHQLVAGPVIRYADVDREIRSRAVTLVFIMESEHPAKSDRHIRVTGKIVVNLQLIVAVTGWVIFYFTDTSRLGRYLSIMFGLEGQT